MSEAFNILEGHGPNDVLIVADHASNKVPEDIELGIDTALLQEHIAWDIGVAAVAERLVRDNGHTALLGAVSRLVTDFNRYPQESDVMPSIIDSIEIKGNNISAADRDVRMTRFFNPFHTALADMLEKRRPKFALFLHSYTPALMSAPKEARPWDVGVLYNKDERAARLALDFLSRLSLHVGDQLPYTGLIYNATMVRQAEARDIPYFCFEIRQDHIADDAGADKWAEITQQLIGHVVKNLNR